MPSDTPARVVVVADLQLDGAETVAAAIRASGGRANAEALDVRNAAAVKALIDSVAAKDRAKPRLPVRQPPACCSFNGEVRDLALEDWKFQLEVNLGGVVHGVVAAYPIMVRTRALAGTSVN